MAEQTSDTPTEEASVPQDVAAPTIGAREPAGNGEGAIAGAQEAAAPETAGAQEAPAGDESGAREAPPPGRGPVVLADERGKPERKPPTASRRAKAAPKPKPQRPRRRKRSAAERHRAVFFARLNELRRGEQTGNGSTGEEAELDGRADATRSEEAAPEGAPTDDAMTAAEAPAAEAQPAAPETGEPIAETPEAHQPVAEEPTAGETPADEVEQPRVDVARAGDPPASGCRAAPPPPVSQARLAAAVQRVGGPEVVEEALRPKMDEQGERKKWALVCCEAAQGRQAGDPEFTAWLRLAATPVREIKGSLPVREEQSRGGGRRSDGPGRPGGGPGRGGDRGGRGGDGPG
ncbi:MAG: hypothetical protein MSC31_12460, partial [Solirubrobacteraceae bacterium MAG38_C4-C5]|nr:hypothetical protein [Candidatus Siliceabacter maunaloa]